MEKIAKRNSIMDKYRNSSISLNSPTNRLLNSGPLYTMGSSNSQQQGPKLLMNSVSVGTSTKFQFVPARNSSTNFSGPFQFGIGSITPIFNTVKTFFVNLIKPNVDVDTNSTYNTIEKRKCNSAPNIYMDIMSDRKFIDNLDKDCVVDLTDLDMLAKLSSSTKSFSDYNLPINTIKINSTPKPQQGTNKMDLNFNLKEPKPTKERTVPVVNSPPSSVPVPLLHQKQNKDCLNMPNVPTKPRTQCRNEKRTKKKKTRKSTKSGKNKKENKRHELAFKIHEDVETENETMSTDEWDEPLVIISPTKTSQTEPLEEIIPPVVTFSKDDFPAMPECRAIYTTYNLNQKQTWELPRLSHCFSAFNRKKQRQISECDSEDSFIVFDNDDKSTPSSVESNPSICDRIQSTLGHRQISESSDDDDFICFKMENSDTDDDDDCDQNVTSDSDSEVDDVISSGTNPPDSGFEERKVSFNLNPVVHVLRVWRFAYQQARKGEWEQIGRDRVRFLERVKRMESILLPILDSNHRQKIYHERFFENNDSSDNEVQ